MRDPLIQRSTGFASIVESVGELRALYRAPTERVMAKKQPSLDEVTSRFVESSPFVLLATTGSNGTEVSPRGGPPGFVRVLDPGRIAIPDLNGNNLLDSMVNIVNNPSVGLLFVHPGKSETLRLNGNAYVSTDDELRQQCAEPAADGTRLAVPRVVIGVAITHVFIHCAKAFMRGRVWDSTSWSELDPVDGVDIIQCHFDMSGPKDQVRSAFDAGYAAELAQDLAPASD
jgi:uncharacterized protein